MQAALVPIYQKQHGAPVPIHIFRGNLKKYSSSYQLLIFRILLTDRPHQLPKPVIPGKNITLIIRSLKLISIKLKAAGIPHLLSQIPGFGGL